MFRSLFYLVADLITCGSLVGLGKFLQAPILKDICERLLLCYCGFVILFSMLWYNVLLIFNHFTCYLNISPDQLSSVFSWSLTYLARALVMFPIFFFPFLCVTKVVSYKISLGPFIIYHVRKSWLHLQLLRNYFTSLLCPCYNWSEQVIIQIPEE